MTRKKRIKLHRSPIRSNRGRGISAPDKNTTSIQLEVLEQRVMFSADVLGIPLTEWAADTTIDDAVDQPFWSAESDNTDELIFIDSSVPQRQVLIDDLRQQISKGRSAVIVLLQPVDDGLNTITETLKNYNSLSAIHIISHGSDQGIAIGDTWLTNDVALENISLLNQWQSALTDSADLLIYGCNLAASDNGLSLVNTLARETQADVAASIDSTGHNNLGANWTLEHASGPIESNIHLSDAARQAWENELATKLQAIDDDLGSVVPNTPLILGDDPTIADVDLTANDFIVPGNDNISFINVVDPVNGSITENNNDTFTFTPDTNHFGPASADYIISDGGNDLIHHWRLDSNANGVAVDQTGRNDGIVSGSSFNFGPPAYLEFIENDAVQDKILIPPVDFPDTFTLSFEFRLDEEGVLKVEQFLDIGESNPILSNAGSIGIWYGNNEIHTALQGTQDDNGVYISIPVASIINAGGTNNWHSYTLAVDNSGATPRTDIYIDDMLQRTIAIGKGSLGFNDIYMAAWDPLDIFFDFSLDSQLYEHHMRDFRIYEGVKVPTATNDFLHDPVLYSDATVDLTYTNVPSDAPDITLNAPATLTVTEDTTLSVIPSVSFTHGLDPNTQLRATIEAENGTLKASGATNVVVAGVDTNLLTIEGTPANVNAALSLLEYNSDPHFHGADTLLVNIDALKLTDMQDINWQQSTSSQQPISPQTLVDDPVRGKVIELRNGDYLEHSTIPAAQELSFSAWVNLEGTGATGAELFNISNNVGLRLDNSTAGVTGFFKNAPAGTWLLTNSPNDPDAKIEGKGWQHVAYVITDGHQAIYINGVEVATTYHSTYDILDGNGAPQPLIDYSTGTLTRIGAHAPNSDTQFQFDGLVDDAAIHARELSVEEIQALATGASYAGETSATQLTVTPVNDAPVLSNSVSDSTVVTNTLPINEATAPQNIVLEPIIEIRDIEAEFSGNYNHATLTLERTNASPDGEPGQPPGANADDLFSSNLPASFGNLAEGTILPFATVLKNSDGTLQIQFNGNATKPDADTLMRSITYSNLSQWPPSVVDLTWTFEDQGTDNNGNTDPGTSLASTITTKLQFASVNQPPVVSTNNLMTLESGSTDFINSISLETTDPDNTSADLVYQIENNPAGTLYLNGSAVNVFTNQNNIFTQKDIDDGNLSYVARNDPPGTTDSFLFSVRDGNGGLVSNNTFNIELALNASQELLVPDDQLNGYLIAIFNPSASSASGYTFSIDNTSYNGPFSIDTSNGEITVADETKLNHTEQELHTLAISAVSNDDNSIVEQTTINIRLISKNEAPVLSSSITQPTLYIENSLPTVIDSAITVTDEELDTYDDYSGAIATLYRYDAAANTPAINTDDTYHGSGDLSALNEGSSFSYNSNIIGQVIKNSGGELALYFSQAATRTDINGTLQSIAYANSSDTPTQQNNNLTEQVNFLWTLDDGNLNTGANAQGITNNPASDNLTTTHTSTLDILPVNDAPVGADNTISTNEDSSITLQSTDFGFSDPLEGDLFAAVTITALPLDGSLTLAGIVVTTGQTISITAINAGDLVFTPAGNQNGLDYTSFDFQVHDIGGTANGGIDQDQTTNKITINVNSINDAPAGENNTLSVNEDSAIILQPVHFGFSDRDDDHFFAAVTVTTLPTNGTLTIANTSITMGQTVSITDINNGDLVFTPAADQNGTGYSDFNFQVHDDGGIANGGIDQDQTPNTMTFDVISTNDAPAGTNNTLNTNEDTSITLQSIDFGFSDSTDNDFFSAVTIATLPSSGTLTLANVPVTIGQLVSVARINNGELVFTPSADENGLGYTDFDFQVHDNGGTANGGIDQDQSPNTITFNVNSINDAPTGTDSAVTTNEDTPVTLQSKDFGFSDPIDGDFFAAITITTLPTNGTLSLANAPVTIGQTVSIADINNGDLIFTPELNESGTNYDSLDFQVHDNGGTANGGIDKDPVENTLAIHVKNTNDAPDGTDNTLTTNEDTGITLSYADFGYSDTIDGDIFAAVTITILPNNGALTLSNVPVTAGQTVSITDINNGDLVFTPATNQSGTGYANYDFQVHDNGGTANGGIDQDQIPNTININVNSINDAPSGTDNILATNEDSTIILQPTDFGFYDPNDSNSLAAVTITTLPNNGTLSLSNTPVTLGQTISITDIVTGSLIFTPASNQNGATYANFEFQVHDNGGTNNGGIDQDQTPNIITVNVNSINDAPYSADRDISIIENGTYFFSDADFEFNDIDGNALLGITITDMPANGAFSLNNIPVALGQFVPVASINNLNYSPTPDAYQAGYDSFGFTIQDDGGTSNGGIDTDPVENRISIDVIKLNDAPNARDNSITGNEDGVINFTTADFGFTDIDGDSFQSIIIDSVSLNGNLRLYGQNVAVGQLISASEIHNLTYIPSPNANGNPHGSFDFKVQDDGGVLNNGQDTSLTPNTITINLNPVNDSPYSADRIITISEDTSYDFNVSDFAFNDIDGDQLESLLITQLPENGQLSLNGTDILTSQTIPAAQISSLSFTPEPDANRTDYDRIGYFIQDDGGVFYGGNDTDETESTININVTSVNDSPSGTDIELTISEDTSYTFSNSDFGFSDSDNNNLMNIIVDSLPLTGSLTHNGLPVSVGQSIPETQLSELQFIPAPNGSGVSYAFFDFRAQDDGGTTNGGTDTDATSKTVTINVVESNDAPFGTDNTVSILEDTPYVLDIADFGFNDSSDNNAFAAITVLKAPVSGSLQIAGVTVTDNSVVSTQDIALGTLIYTPPTDAYGINLDEIMFNVLDDGGTTNQGQNTSTGANKLSFNIDSINDEPSGADSVASTLEDTLYTLSRADFGFDDSDGDDLSAIIVVTLPENGTLRLANTTVVASDVIQISDIDVGALTFIPAPDENNQNTNGADYANLTFAVQDNGGTDFGGVDTDQSPNLLTIDVLPVNDAPTATDNEIVILEDSIYQLTLQDFPFSDVENDTIQSVRFASLPAAGKLQLNNTDVDTVSEISASAIANGDLRFVPDPNINGTTQFEFTIRDNGGTAQQGIDQNPETNTLLFIIEPVNDAPVSTDTTVTITDNLNYTLSLTDFEFNDDENHGFLAVRIDALPSSGILTLAGLPVKVGDVIDIDSINQGSLSYIPVQDSGIPSSTFRYSAIDSGGTENGGQNTSEPADLAFDIESINDAPVANPDTLQVAEGQTTSLTTENSTSLLSNDTDVEGDTLTASLVKAPDHGEFELFADGTFRYSHDGSETVIDEITYSVSDGSVTAESTVMINITPVNDAPIAGVIGNSITTVSEEFTLTLPENHFIDLDDESPQVTATLADGSPLPEWLVFNAATMTFNGSPTEAETLSIILTAADAQGLLAQSAFTVTVSPEPQIAAAIKKPVILTLEETPPEVTIDEQPVTETIVENESFLGEDISFQTIPDTAPESISTDIGDNALEIASFASEATIFRDFDLLSRSIETHRQFKVSSLTESGSLIEVQEIRSLADLFSSEDNRILNNTDLLNQLNEQREQMQQSFILNGKVISGAVSVSTGLSVGYVIWLVRGGLLLGSVISSLPAWRNIDPLPVLSTLNSDDDIDQDDSLEDLVEEKDTQNPEQGPGERQEN